MAQTSFTIIETKPSSSGQKNTPVITVATIRSPTVRTSRWRRPRLQNAMRNQDCSPPHWMVGFDAKRPPRPRRPPVAPRVRESPRPVDHDARLQVGMSLPSSAGSSGTLRWSCAVSRPSRCPD